MTADAKPSLPQRLADRLKAEGRPLPAFFVGDLIQLLDACSHAPFKTPPGGVGGELPGRYIRRLDRARQCPRVRTVARRFREAFRGRQRQHDQLDEFEDALHDVIAQVAEALYADDARQLTEPMAGEDPPHAFLRAVLAGDDDRPLLPESLWASQADELLAAAAAAGAAEGGIVGMDLQVLQTCLQYRPIEGLGARDNRLRQVAATLRPRAHAYDPLPEFGNFGITRKGKPSSALRSQMARPAFVERVVLGDMVYYDRRRPRQQPPLVLLAYVIDRGPAMAGCSRPAGRGGHGPPLDTQARRLVACLVEDAVRHVVPCHGLDVRLAVHLYAGDETRFQWTTLVPESNALRAAPGPESPPQAWLPTVPVFMRHYMPVEARHAKREDHAMRGAATRPPHEMALQRMCRDVAVASEEFVVGDRREFEFCYAVVVDAREPDRAASAGERLVLEAFASSAVVRQVRMTAGEAILLGTGGRQRSAAWDYGTDRNGVLADAVRNELWTDLLNQVARL